MFLLASRPGSFRHLGHYDSFKVANMLFSIPLALESASDLPSDPSGPVSASWLQGRASMWPCPFPTQSSGMLLT